MRALDAAGNAGAWSNGGQSRFVNVGRFDSDFNGDGYSDAIVGADGYKSFQGGAYIYFGGVSIDANADVIMEGELNSYFGNSVASAGDVNGDGYGDVIVGAYFYNTGQGKAYVYLGGASMDANADAVMTGESDSYFGNSVASAGDMNGDGYSDVIVGARSYNSGYNYGNGRAYVYLGGVSMDSTADITMTGEGQGNYLGESVASAGDVNGDGYSDVIVSAYGYNGAKGRVYIFFGSASMNNTPDVIIDGESGLYFGSSVASGDVNGDGYCDVIIGQSYYNSGQGRAYVYLGGVSMDTNADVTMTGESGSSFGKSVASAGDVNRDGYCDVIVGADSYNSRLGRAYVYLGDVSMDAHADVTMTGESQSDFGCSVSSAGDVNGDGYNDVIVGADGYDYNIGRAYICLGGASMDAHADVTMGDESSFSFGSSVASAGDVNVKEEEQLIAEAWQGIPAEEIKPGMASEV
jgi:hypothetical protein